MNPIQSLVHEWNKKIHTLAQDESVPASSVVSIPHVVSNRYVRRKRNHVNVAVIVLRHAPATEKVVAGMKKELEAQAPGVFSISLFNAPDERMVLQYATQIVRSYLMPYDIVVPIGLTAAQIVTRTSLYLNIPIPIIFNSVPTPANFGIIYPGKRPTQNVSGVASPSMPYEKYVATLQILKKNARRILLPFDATIQYNLTIASELSRLFSCRGIELITLHTKPKTNLRESVYPYIHKVDTVVSLRDASVINQLNDMVQLCNTYGVTLYSADIESVQKGASIGFATSDTHLGKETASYLLTLFKEDASPHELPITTSSARYHVALNTQAFEQQGLSLDQGILDSLQDKILFGEDTPHDIHEKNSSAP